MPSEAFNVDFKDLVNVEKAIRRSVNERADRVVTSSQPML